MSQSAVLDPWRRSRPGSRRERSALGRVRPRARTAGATRPGPRTKPGKPAAEHRGFAREAKSVAHTALSFARKVKSLARDPKSLAHGAPGLTRKAVSFAREARSLTHEAPGLACKGLSFACKARSLAPEAPRAWPRASEPWGRGEKGLEAGARGLGGQAWRPGEPDRRKAGDAARPPAPSPRPVRRDGTRCNEPLKFLPFTLRSLPKDSDVAPWKTASGPASPRPPSIFPSRAAPPCSMRPELARHG